LKGRGVEGCLLKAIYCTTDRPYIYDEHEALTSMLVMMIMIIVLLWWGGVGEEAQLGRL